MEALSPFLEWIAAHPTWAGLVVFFIAFAESLAVVGLFMPGAALMFGVGALVGTGSLELLPTLVWAAAGAVAGDGISFWIGRRFQQQLPQLWPFRTHPALIDRSTAFFHRHGGKSILFGRFVGPIRPVIPAVAGMLGMTWARFLPVNVVSGLLWAPAYVLPGMVFAASLGLAAEVATRLVLALLLLTGLVLLVVWAVRRLFELLHPRTHALLQWALGWSDRHPVMGRLPAALVDPEHPEARGLTLLALLLLGAVAGFASLWQAVSGGPGLLHGLDQLVHHALADLRTPAMDRLMVLITELGDGRVLAGLFSVVLLLLAVGRHWQAASHWSAAGLFALAAPKLVKFATEVARPNPALYEGVANYSFPSGHATQSTVLFGFLAVLIARNLPANGRLAVYAATAVLVSAIGLSRLYLGAHWLSDVLAGLSLGLAWVAALGIAYSRHAHGTPPAGSLGLGAALGLGLFAILNASADFAEDLRRYAPLRSVQALSADHWQAGGWRALPKARSELLGDVTQPLNLQYAGALEPFRTRLVASGWEAPSSPAGLGWLHWLRPDAPLARLPVLPQVHDGHYEALRLIRPRDENSAWVLRLWPSDVRLSPGGRPLWLGNVALLEKTRTAGLTVPRTRDGFADGLRQLAAALPKPWLREPAAGTLLVSPPDAKPAAPASSATAAPGRHAPPPAPPD